MSATQDLARKHFDALLSEASEQGIPADVIGRALLARFVEQACEARGWNDVASELRFTADSLDPDTDFEFMRP